MYNGRSTRTKRKGVTRIQSAEESAKRAFHRQLHKLERLCGDNNIILYNYEEADDNMICILSSSEYELGDTKPYCSEENENYFVTESDLNKLYKLQNNED